MSVVTAQALIDSSARLIQITGGNGDSLNPTESTNALATLNDMIEAWNLENFLIYAHTNQTFNITANTATYAIGTGQTWNTTRPVGIRNGYTTLSGIDYPFLMIGDAEFNQILYKANPGSWPQVANYTASYPYGSIVFWPVPAQDMTCTLNLDTKLTSIATLATSIDLPPGYSKLLRYGLAIELAPEYNIPVPKSVMDTFNEVKGNIKVANLPDDVLNFDTSWSTGVPYYYNGRVV